MPRISLEDTKSFHSLYKKSYTYLDDNFHKFKEEHRIQIAIAVCRIAVPQKLEHSGEIKVAMPVIQKQLSGEANEINNRIAEYDIGSINPPEDS